MLGKKSSQNCMFQWLNFHKTFHHTFPTKIDRQSRDINDLRFPPLFLLSHIFPLPEKSDYFAFPRFCSLFGDWPFSILPRFGIFSRSSNQTGNLVYISDEAKNNHPMHCLSAVVSLRRVQTPNRQRFAWHRRFLFEKQSASEGRRPQRVPA